jgi:CCR4-NOT transcription complex subunit 6
MLQFRIRNYEPTFFPKPGNREHGILIAHDKNVFTHPDYRSLLVEYNDIALGVGSVRDIRKLFMKSDVPITREEIERQKSRLLKNDIGGVVFIRHKYMDRIVAVANTHIYWNPKHEDVKFAQVYTFLKKIESAGRNTYPTGRTLSDGSYFYYRNLMPLVLAGDFNSMSSSPFYKLVTKRCVNTTDLPNFKIFSGEFDIDTELSDVFSTDIYEQGGIRPDYTTYTRTFQEQIDHMFFNPNVFDVKGIQSFPDDEEVTKETALPNSTWPSDHVPIKVWFSFGK